VLPRMPVSCVVGHPSCEYVRVGEEGGGATCASLLDLLSRPLILRSTPHGSSALHTRCRRLRQANPMRTVPSVGGGGAGGRRKGREGAVCGVWASECVTQGVVNCAQPHVTAIHHHRGSSAFYCTAQLHRGCEAGCCACTGWVMLFGGCASATTHCKGSRKGHPLRHVFSHTPTHHTKTDTKTPTHTHTHTHTYVRPHTPHTTCAERSIRTRRARRVGLPPTSGTDRPLSKRRLLSSA
jgi:hypothetical protein